MVTSSIQVCGSFLFKISNGVSVKPSTTTSITPQHKDSFANSLKHAIKGSVVLSRNISSSSWYTCTSSFDRFLMPIGLENGCLIRKIITFGPVCMGRKSCKIAGRKGVKDAKKTKLYGRIAKEVISAVKKGGPNPVSNTALAALIEKAKELDVPKDILERNIKRASEKGQEAYIEKFYELYGYGGVGVIAEVLTDKVTRAMLMIRGVVKDYGGKMADSGSIMFKFRRARVATIKVTDVDKDQLFSIALEAGADDVIEPSFDEDDINENSSERCEE
ncbi:hypothetical protein Leryth_021349 [Lithospermum erythrorhizon]|nr:hypothetical protein Leryth_021349 [Lithospermum erythrorhizon]